MLYQLSYPRDAPYDAWKRRRLRVGREGFEPPKTKSADLQSAPVGRLGTDPQDCQSRTAEARDASENQMKRNGSRRVELVEGFEPPTC